MKGIIMSGDHPRKILDGIKTMTRRVIKLPDAPNHLGQWEPTYLGGDGVTKDSRGQIVPRIDGVWHTRTGKFVKCPYGQVGDRLWVRETYLAIYPEVTGRVIYRADCDYKDKELSLVKEGHIILKWKPSIFMPRWASRITLEITKIRAERVQEITLADCIKEGMPGYTIARGCVSNNPPDPRWNFIELWDSLNAKRGYSWEVNPWVWVISFQVVREILK